MKYKKIKVYKFNEKQLTSIGKIGVSKDNLIFIFPLLATLDESHEHAFCTTDFKSCDVWYASYASKLSAPKLKI